MIFVPSGWGEHSKLQGTIGYYIGLIKGFFIGVGW